MMSWADSCNGCSAWWYNCLQLHTGGLQQDCNSKDLCGHIQAADLSVVDQLHSSHAGLMKKQGVETEVSRGTLGYEAQVG